MPTSRPGARRNTETVMICPTAVLGVGPSARGSTGGASRAGADPMASSACAEFCCVAKRFDRPFLRLPAAAVSAPDASAGPPGAGDDERRSAADVDARETAAAAAAVDATAEGAANLAESSDPDGDADDSDETEAEETATRARLDEILRTISERGASSSDADAASPPREMEWDEQTAAAHGNGVTSPDSAAFASLPEEFLEPLAHMSHRRERHCRVILQHACADAVIRGAARFLRQAAAEEILQIPTKEERNRAPDVVSGDDREPNASQNRTETAKESFCVSRAYAGELAALLIHNLSIAASAKEPRDDDESYLDEPDFKHPELEKDGKYDPVMSVVKHARWEGLVRDVFAMCEKLARREREKSPYETSCSSAAVSDREEPRRARPAGQADATDGSLSSHAARRDEDERAAKSASALKTANETERVDAEKEKDEHAVLCRGALGTYTGAFLALLEPDSARPRLLQMDDGAFVLRVFRCMGSILPARHGDAALDAVGVLHRVLWLRPDASTKERRGLMRALVAMETPLRSLDPREIERVDESALSAFFSSTDSHDSRIAVPTDSDRRFEPEPTDADEQCDPDDLWDWRPVDGYCLNSRPGEPFHPFRWHPKSDRETLWRDCEAQAERVSVNGVLAGLRTHLPPPGSAGEGSGAAGGTVACTQAVHALRALFEDLQILDAQAKYERALMPRDFASRAMWRQLRTAQMRELVEQLACVVETLGQGAPKNDEDDEKKKKTSETSDEGTNKTTRSGDGSPDASLESVQEAAPSENYSGAWRGFKTTIPKEGQCDGAVGASVAVFSAILHHPFQSSTLEEHPGFDGVWNAVTRAMASRCSCAWATFSAMSKLAGKGGYAAKRLMSMPASGCLLNALTCAVCDKWPAVALADMPPATFLPRADASASDEKSAEREDDASRKNADCARAGPKKKRRRRRREAWREKTAKELAKDAKAEARSAKKAKRDAAQRLEKANEANEASIRDSADDDAREGPPVAAMDGSRDGDSGDAPADASDDDSDDDSDSEEDPLASSSNRLLLRATAAATLASFAHVQRHWDELDRGEALSRYDQDATLDAIDVDDADDADGAWRPRKREEYNRVLKFADVPETVQALELWYAARGGDAAGAPSRADIRAAREGVRVAFAAHRARRADYEDPGEADEAAERFARDARIETWWTARWREGLYEERRRREAAEAATETATNAPAPESSSSRAAGFAKTDGASSSSPPRDSDRAVTLLCARRDDASAPHQLDAEAMRATSWPLHSVRPPQTRKGPLPGGADPEGVLGTVPLMEDILAVLSQPASRDDAERDRHDTGVAVEAIETLVSDDKARWLMLLFVEPVLECLANRIDETAKLAKRAAANGGFLPPPPKEDGDFLDDEGDAKKKKKKKKSKRKKSRVSVDALNARNALIVHTLYSVTKEAEREVEGSAWPVLIARSDVLLDALYSILAQAREAHAAVPPGGAKHDERDPKAVLDSASEASTRVELARNVIIVLAEMADPANSRDAPELGASWAEGVVTRKPWLVDELVRIMAAGASEDVVREAVRGKSASSSSEDKRDAVLVADAAPMRLSASADPSAKTPARFAFPKTNADGSAAAAFPLSSVATEPEPEPEETENAHLGGMAFDCAHIAAAAVFGLLSWDKSIKAFLERESEKDSGLPSAGALISRALALMSDAWKPDPKAGACVLTDADPEDPAANFLDAGQTASLRGVESAGLMARLAGEDDSRRALLAHAPGIVGYLVPCLDSRLGQTAAFAARALSGLARGEAMDEKKAQSGLGFLNPKPSVLEKYPYPEKLVEKLVGMLAEPDSKNGTGSVADESDGGSADLRKQNRDPGLEAHVLSEAVVAVATLAQAKPWRWRLTDVLSTSLTPTHKVSAQAPADGVVATRRAFEARRETNEERSADAAALERATPFRPEGASLLVTHLARLLSDAKRPEIVFNALYCVNCLMGEPPQSWGRGRDESREEDHAARRAFIKAATNVGPETASIETALAEILHPEFAAAYRGGEREDEEEHAPPPDCRLNATLVIANIAGDAEGRRRLLEVAGDRLVSGLAAAIVGPDPERAMLAAYSLGELARPLPGVELALGGAARAELAARGVEDRHVFSDSGGGDNKKRGLDPSFVKALPFLERAVEPPRPPLLAAEALDPFFAMRHSHAEAVFASTRNAEAAARAVLVDGEAHLRFWIANGDDALDSAVAADGSYSYARDHRAQLHLRALPLPVKRKWLLEMLRWELGPVSAGVPVPGVQGVSLAVDRAKVLRDLCKHCEVPGEENRPASGSSVRDSDASDSDEEESFEASNETDGTTNATNHRARGAFLSPPRGGVSVRFRGERGEGAALRREWFALVAEKSADFAHGLFVSHDGGVTLHPHACSGVVNAKTHLKYFAALGRVAAVALYHGETLPLRLTDAFFDRAALGARARLEDLRSVDPDLFESKVRYLRELSEPSARAKKNEKRKTSPPEDRYEETEDDDEDDARLNSTLRALDLEWRDAADPTGVFFPGETRAFFYAPKTSFQEDARDSRETSSGDFSDTTPVTADTLACYLRAFVAHRTYGSVAWQTAAFAAGFGAIVPAPLRVRARSVLSGAEVSVLVAGERGEVDVADWKRNTGYADASLAVSFSTACFWHAMEHVLSAAERVDALRFATGLSTPPAGGFANLVGYAGDAAPFTVAELASDKRDAPNALPMAHACFNTIRLPRLREEEFGNCVEAGGAEMARRLRVATTHGFCGFDNF